MQFPPFGRVLYVSEARNGTSQLLFKGKGSRSRGRVNFWGISVRLLALSLVTITSPVTHAEPYAGEQVLKDNDITLAVESELLTDPAIPTRLIDVITTNGVVTLSGSVDNILAKERATAVTQAIKGVRAVVNNISVTPQLRTDMQIHEEVVIALAQDPAVDLYELTATVEEGVVTLSGTVQSWPEQQLAVQVAKTVRGVKDVRNEIVINYKITRPDEEIAADVTRRLQRDVLVDAELIDVDVNNGKVRLRGTVGSAAEKAQARADAWVAGVKSIDNSNLEVQWWARDEDRRKTAHPVKSDEEIKQAVLDAFTYDPRVFSFTPIVYVQNRVVTLTGAVNNLQAKLAAEEDARNTIGVWRVKNYLKVRPVQPPNDEIIAQSIREALEWNPYVTRADINVSVTNGAAYLTGTVDSKFEEDRAQQVASNVKGVAEVNNSLITRKEQPWKRDQEIKEDIQSEFFWSPFVDADEISISVQNGIATLTGTVDSLREMRAAIENARDGGAVWVNSELHVRGLHPVSPLASGTPASAP